MAVEMTITFVPQRKLPDDAASTSPIAGALLTADGRDELKREARERGYRLLTKPVKPASLRAFLAAHHIPAPTPPAE